MFLKMLLKKRNSKLSRRSRLILRSLIVAVTLFITTNIISSSAKTLSAPYTDSSYLTNVPWGSHSHWLQPWRAYMETIPATTFLAGTGIVWNQKEEVKNPELLAQMLAKHGIRQVRFGINWSTLDYDNETKLKDNRAEQYRLRLLALQKYGIRPLILLNAHHGTPCPHKFSRHTVATDARAGDMTLQLNNVAQLKANYSGFKLNDEAAAETLITEISGNTVTLSKPLPKDIKAGSSLRAVVLKYRPFSVPGSQDYQETMRGWKLYVDTVTQFVADTLATTDSDRGFDLEIWNELTFGSNFLYINKYYAGNPYDYDEKSIWSNLVEETAAYVEANPSLFQGVQISNGFSNTIPWVASSQQPAQIDAMSKHPYRKRNNYPQDENQHTKSLNALGKTDDFVPTYSTLFPEYQSTALRSNTIIRDIAPITTKINGVEHGRYARGVNDAVPVWITEVNLLPKWIDPNITAENALAVKAKTTARYLCFYLNKGVKRVYLYGAAGGDRGWGIVKQSFLDYGKQNIIYPTDDTDYISPALKTIERIVSKMSEEIDRNLENTRQLEVASIEDSHDSYQFKGDGSKANPNLYNREVFAFLPFQVNSSKFVIPYYVMTRDLAHKLKPENFTVGIEKVKGTDASVTVYDPIEDRVVPVTVKSRESDSLTLELTAADYPYLLTIQEAKSVSRSKV